MLTPEYYENCTRQLVELYSELDNAIISDITRRLVKNGEMTETAKWQAKQLQEAGMLYDDILIEISERSGQSQEEIRRIFKDAGITATRNDNVFAKVAGFSEIRTFSKAALQTLNAGYVKCSGDMSNLTLTTANTSQQLYISAVNNAYMQIMSGAFDYNTAIRNAVKAAAAEGSEIIYPSGHRDKLDVAVRRAVLTGVGQTCRQLSEINAHDMGTDLMEITAHAGARPSHAEWQGKVVSLSGRKGYLSKSDIGYGTGDGFGGWNCRHDWYPFFEGISKRAYTVERLKELNAKNIEYNGEMYTEYEISQMQRKMERDIRQLKREAVAADTGAKNASSEELAKQFSDEFTQTSVKLKAKEQKLKDFLNETGQLSDSSRVWSNGFDRSVSQKAVWANKKSPILLTSLLNDATITDKEKAFKEALKLGRINNKIEDSKQRNHISGAPWRNQVKQAIKTINDSDPKKQKTPKSILTPKLDSQSLVDKYGGTGRIVVSGDNKTVNEFITLPDIVGRTFDNNSKRYIATHTIQIKYTDKGTHVFPTKELINNGI